MYYGRAHIYQLTPLRPATCWERKPQLAELLPPEQRIQVRVLSLPLQGEKKSYFESVHSQRILFFTISLIFFTRARERVTSITRITWKVQILVPDRSRRLSSKLSVPTSPYIFQPSDGKERDSANHWRCFRRAMEVGYFGQNVNLRS